MLALVLLAAHPAFSQDAERAESAEPIDEIREAPDVDEITVMGERGASTDVQDEAAAITAFSMDDLDKANIVNVEGLAFNTPGLHVGRQGNNIIVTLRGIGTENATITGETGVVFTVDGVPYLRPASAQTTFFDLENVSVLRGPQGTKGGKNTTSGWISLATRKPHNEFEMSGDYQVGSFNQRRVRTSLNLPINEYAQARFAFFSENRDGYQDNLFLNDDDRNALDRDSAGWRAHLNLNLTPELNLLSSFNYFKQGGVGPMGELLPLESRARCGTGIDRISQLPTPLACPNPLLHGQPSEDTINTPNQLRSDFGRTQDNTFWGVSETLTYQAPSLPFFGETEVKLIGGFQSSEVSFAQDFDGTEIDFSVLHIPLLNSKQYSGEAQWYSQAGELVDWQLSAFFQREASDQEVTLSAIRGFFSQDPAGNIDPDSIRDLDTNVFQSAESKAYGLALHTDWYLTDSTTLALGARYSKDTKRASLVRQNPDIDSPGALLSCESFAEVDVNPRDFFPDRGVAWCKKSFRELTGGARLEHRLTDANMLYARADRGYKAGGFNALTPGSFDPEFIWAYALGSKNQFFDDRLTLNIEGFYYEYSDLQLLVRDGLAFNLENGDAEIYGVDLEGDLELFAGLRLESSVGYLHTELTEYDSLDPTARIIDDQGNEIVSASLRDQCIRDPTKCPIRPDAPGTPPLPGERFGTGCYSDGARTAVGPPCRFSSFPTSDFSGNELSRSPEWKLRFAAEYTLYLESLGLGNLGSLTPRIQYYWQSNSFYRAYNTPIDEQSHYHQTDIKLTWHSVSDAMYVELFIDNLEDNEVFQNTLVGDRRNGSPSTAWYDSPRTWGIRAGFRY